MVNRKPPATKSSAPCPTPSIQQQPIKDVEAEISLWKIAAIVEKMMARLSYLESRFRRIKIALEFTDDQPKEEKNSKADFDLMVSFIERKVEEHFEQLKFEKKLKDDEVQSEPTN